MKILLLEDDATLSRVIKKGLEKENYAVDCFFDGELALNAISNGYSCFILDINTPSLDGISILKNIRDYLGASIPVIIISSNHELEKIKASYEKGCNDYIKKPFFIYELVQKVKHLCQIEFNFIEFNDSCKYNFMEHTLYVNNEKIILARKEILFLELFISNLNRIVTYAEIETYVWEGEDSNIDNIRALIKRIRKKLPNESIQIVTGYGYTLNKECKYS
ncbi:response regulator transcription factor [Arcobacter sp. 15-2]|uniref:response regulator transcription factor n=1 Tax=Arcobacter sp. 15-2 TaxID=3374109 RepID=UPI00399C85E9